MIKRNFLLILILLASSAIGSAQIEVGAEIQDFYKTFQMSNNEFTKASKGDYDGSPYLNDEFLPGIITTPDNVIYTGVDIRYNIYKDNFEFNQNGIAMTLERSSRWPKFELNDQLFEYKHYSYKSVSTKGYLETLINGNYSLHLKHSVVLKEAEKPGAYSEATKALFYSLRPEIMVGRDGRDIVIISSANDLTKEFPETKDMMKEFSGNKKLKLKRREDFIEFIEFLNSKNQ